jgi:hypothetical protein
VELALGYGVAGSIDRSRRFAGLHRLP